MNHTSPSSSKSSGQIEVLQSLFEEILQIQKENKQTDESLLRIQEIILESSRVVGNSTSTNEMIVDAKILQAGTEYVSSNVISLKTNLTSFSESKYISGLLSYIENSNQVLQVMKEWECFGSVTYPMFKKSHPVSYMLGSFTFEPPPVKERAKVVRKTTKKSVEKEKQVVSKLTEKENCVEADRDIYDHILKWLVRKYKKNNNNPINFFSFIIDPNDYWRTIENIFYFAFLVRDGTVKMSIENELPFVEPVLKNTQEETTQEHCNNQFCFRLSVQEWEECIERFEVCSACIPPLIKKS